MTQSHSTTTTDLPPAGPGRLSPTADGRRRFDIDEDWIADLSRDVMIVHRNPDADACEYCSVQQYGNDASISPQAISDCHLDLGWLFN